jgi:photosystem II stability/assembly factor-like uncharacterized protein
VIKTLLTFLLLTSFFTTNAQWIQVSSGTSYDLQDVHFPTDSVGYIVGYYGIILKSNDIGESWEVVHADSAKSFQSVFFTDKNKGYAAGGNLYQTIDGGENWDVLVVDSLDQMQEVYFVNDSLGFASGTKLYITRDGGKNWSEQYLGNTFSSIYFPSDSVGYFIGGPDLSDPLYKTVDRGQSFIPITNGFQSIKESVHFIDDNTGFMCGWYAGLTAKTINGGVSWQQIDGQGEYQCWDIHFIDDNVGYYIDNSGGDHLIRKTRDGGITWNTQLSDSEESLYAFHFINSNTIIAVGSNGTIYKTSNGGETSGTTEALKHNDAFIYPNPANTELYIDSKKGILPNYSVSIYTILGQEVMENNHLAQKEPLDISGLNTGVYYVVIRDIYQAAIIRQLIVF